MQKNQIERIFHEIELLKRLDHPNIVKVIEYYETHEKIYIVMELCNGLELFERIRDSVKTNTPFKEYEIASIVQQLLQAANYLHQNKIVHRDFKPENIMFVKKKSLKIKVIDFGCAQKFVPG